MRDLVIVQSAKDCGDFVELLDVQKAIKDKLLHLNPWGHPENIASGNPNLALTVRGAVLSSKELWFWVFLGVRFQSFALAFPVVATYH